MSRKKTLLNSVHWASVKAEDLESIVFLTFKIFQRFHSKRIFSTLLILLCYATLTRYGPQLFFSSVILIEKINICSTVVYWFKKLNFLMWSIRNEYGLDWIKIFSWNSTLLSRVSSSTTMHRPTFFCSIYWRQKYYLFPETIPSSNNLKLSMKLTINVLEQKIILQKNIAQLWLNYQGTEVK